MSIRETQKWLESFIDPEIMREVLADPDVQGVLRATEPVRPCVGPQRTRYCNQHQSHWPAWAPACDKITGRR